MDIYEVKLEVYHDNVLVQKQTLAAPKEIIMMQFLNLAKQIRNTNEKYKIKLIRSELIWIPWDNKHKVLENCIELQNYEE